MRSEDEIDARLATIGAWADKQVTTEGVRKRLMIPKPYDQRVTDLTIMGKFTNERMASMYQIAQRVQQTGDTSLASAAYLNDLQKNWNQQRVKLVRFSGPRPQSPRNALKAFRRPRPSHAEHADATSIQHCSSYRRLLQPQCPASARHN